MTTPDNISDSADPRLSDGGSTGDAAGEHTGASEADFVADTNRSFFSRLYTGTGAFDIISKRRTWYIVTLIMIAICGLSIGLRGFTFGIDFEGGTQIALPASSEVTRDAVETVYSDTFGKEPETVQSAGSGSSATIQLRSEHLTQDETIAITTALAEAFSGSITADDVSSSDVSSTWGSEITEKMIIALVVFLVIVFVYIAVRFDREMSIAAMASLFLDTVFTAGIYSIVGWEVTPATVIGLLTILGFSIYDTVVVFDKVSENTRGFLRTTRRTYAEQANLAVNQTLMRSINTTVISVLPIIALMVIAVWMLGVGTLKDLALIQFVGVIVGAYSSIFLAAPLLVTLKEMRSDVKAHTRKVLERRARIEAGEPVSTNRRVRTVGAGRGARTGGGDTAVPSGKRRSRGQSR
ncbi:protein translocase subunit SecF [Gordonia pseudamarae]|uniref:Protein-export membrane protein SecF n=1 Tax=Gordonia pseudamarae TaxID=2831662 RepID=A0ABX6IIW1_9ACTN|nr:MULTISPECIES: protein translocase subunit SecF [Gordonia]MBD0022491.1 protein translocase subunit SecF [Gordonia sp. (in: high G+C Gram-positive bacteria)]QHN26323.1 protein translocase subunit SecF [Gordonia pseudamarae]QHN35215.1 protein translocase subunit SecF [Gordonia pseudamarae]